MTEPPQTTGNCLVRARSQVLVVDVQSRLAPALADAGDTISRIAVLVRAADALGVPIRISEQYPKGLGATLPEILDLAPDAGIFEKIEFSCARNPALAGAVAADCTAGRDQIIVCGMEAHVCVAQTALDLAAAGRKVYIAADAVASRRPYDKQLALARFRDNFIGVITVEMAVFEWLEMAGTAEFKAVSSIIKPL